MSTVGSVLAEAAADATAWIVAATLVAAILVPRHDAEDRRRVKTLFVLLLVHLLLVLVAGTLAARFSSRTRFWLQFEGCAARPDAGSVDSLRRLGLQIHGADSARGQALQRRHRRSAA